MPSTTTCGGRCAATLLAGAILAACATRGQAPVPALLEPGPQARPLTTISATGVQVYECRAQAGTASWVFVAPEADLFDARGRAIGSHGAGPFWQAHDGSRIEGSVRARAEAPGPGTIAWLLLTTRSTGASGSFSAVTHVQRLHTEGGAAPAEGCEPATAGRRLRVPYRAAYRLFVAA